MLQQVAKTDDFTQEEYCAAYRELTPSRRAHIDRLTHKRRRKQALAGELLAKRLVTAFAQTDTVAIHRDEHGKPFVEMDGVYLSIAHCEDMVACAVDNVPIGIDIERIREVDDKLIDRVCTQAEAVYVREAQTAQRFCEIWTAKEAYVKMLGHSVSHFNKVSVLNVNRQVFRQGEYLIQIVAAE